MATVGGNQVAAFTTPTNSTTADADVVRSNDNTTRAAFNTHDADATIHVQSSVIASRPAAGTAGRFWVTTDSNEPRLWWDNGTAWYEIDYLNKTQGGTVDAAVTLLDALAGTTATFSGAVTAAGATLSSTLRLSDTVYLMFGGTSASYPSLRNSGATLVLRLADDSAPAALQMGALEVLSGGADITGDASVTGDLTVSGTITGSVTGVSTYDRATADTNFVSATDLGLTFAIGATEVWEAEYVLVHTNAGVAGATAQFDIGVPASATGIQFATGGDGSGSATGTVSQVLANYASAFTGFPAGAVAGNPGHLHIRATVIGGGTAGNVTITGTASSGTGTLKAGSFVRATKIA